MSQQDLRVHTEGARYTVRVVGDNPTILEHGQDIASIRFGHACNELCRRANAYDSLSARLAEAVELLQTFRNYECTCADLGEDREFDCDTCQVRTFLDKVKL